MNHKEKHKYILFSSLPIPCQLNSWTKVFLNFNLSGTSQDCPALSSAPPVINPTPSWRLPQTWTCNSPSWNLLSFISSYVSIFNPGQIGLNILHIPIQYRKMYNVPPSVILSDTNILIKLG